MCRGTPPLATTTTPHGALPRIIRDDNNGIRISIRIARRDNKDAISALGFANLGLPAIFAAHIRVANALPCGEGDGGAPERPLVRIPGRVEGPGARGVAGAEVRDVARDEDVFAEIRRRVDLEADVCGAGGVDAWGAGCCGWGVDAGGRAGCAFGWEGRG